MWVGPKRLLRNRGNTQGNRHYLETAVISSVSHVINKVLLLLSSSLLSAAYYYDYYYYNYYDYYHWWIYFVYMYILKRYTRSYIYIVTIVKYKIQIHFLTNNIILNLSIFQFQILVHHEQLNRS